MPDRGPRIIAGSHRGRRLSVPRDPRVRPTSDRVKESLFSMLTPYLDGADFLDLCAGTGGIGLEALSRGARRAAFVDIAGPCLRAIRHNVSALAVEHQAEIVSCDALRYLRRCEVEGRAFDIVFSDPPYASTMASEILGRLVEAPELVRPGGVAVFEHRDPLAPAAEEDLAATLGNRLRFVTTRQYGDKRITIIAREEA